MKTIRIVLQPLDRVIHVNRGTPFIDILNEVGIEFPCGGRGRCGGCRFRIIRGEVPLSDEHVALLKKFDLANDWRLACLCRAEHDVVLEIGQWDTLILADNTPFKHQPKSGFAIAIDLGSTTIVAQLMDLTGGKIVDVRRSLNPQSKYGADIISRIEFSLKGNGLAVLRDTIREKLGEMVHSLIGDRTLDLNRVVIVGNTVMHHIFCGLDLESLSHYPFESVETGLVTLSPSELKWDLKEDIAVQFLPTIGSYVGSDILAGIIAADIHNSERTIALIDLGTNGEIVLGNHERILCASTAAGPAFEGINISRGMTATTGAISSVSCDSSGFKCHVIGNTRARGICGSGLIDAVQSIGEAELMDKRGHLKNDREKIALVHGISITQRDIREFQLAKGALAAGMQLLINQLEIDRHDIEALYIAGAFGHFIDVGKAIKTGLLEFPAEKIHKLGNAALIGAKMFLFLDESVLRDIKAITRHVSLESDLNFQDVFVDKMLFP